MDKYKVSPHASQVHHFQINVVRLFVYATRLAINVSLRKETGVSLYTISAAITVASNSLLFDSDTKRRYWNWVFISVFYYLMFLAQTAA
jgi:hypothetical protein